MSKWIMHAKKADFKGLGEALGVDQVVARIMVNRGLDTEEKMRRYLEPTLSELPDPHLFKDMDKACDLLADAINSGKKIRIIGDYDVDGIMSTYILHQLIKDCGGAVDFAIPHRIEDGYGVNPDMVDVAYNAGIEMIITCDNGIAAGPAVERAIDYGMTFVVTDHHEVPFDVDESGQKNYRLPNAHAVVDPKRQDCQYPFSGICGAQVAWKLAYVLYEKMGFEAEKADKFIQFAAFACVCDVMELVGENRDLVYWGLKKMERTDNPGLKALIARQNLSGQALTNFHIGFVLGPCLNASGRLDTARRSIELLEEEDFDKCISIADELVTLNTQRKELTLAGFEKAKKLVEEQKMDEQNVLVVYMPELHESLAGIVAGRLKELYHKPTIVLTDCEQGVKGSGRSIESYDMFAELSKVKELFTKFGGHPMAAGLSLEKDNVEALRSRLNELCVLTEDDLQEIVKIDVPMPIEYVSEDLIEQLNLLEPFGNGNPKPVFAQKDVPVSKISYMGKDNKFMRISFLMTNGRSMTGVLFSGVDELKSLIEEKYGAASFERALDGRGNFKLDIVYYPQINNFRGRQYLQVVVDKYK